MMQSTRTVTSTSLVPTTSSSRSRIMTILGESMDVNKEGQLSWSKQFSDDSWRKEGYCSISYGMMDLSPKKHQGPKTGVSIKNSFVFIINRISGRFLFSLYPEKSQHLRSSGSVSSPKSPRKGQAIQRLLFETKTKQDRDDWVSALEANGSKIHIPKTEGLLTIKKGVMRSPVQRYFVLYDVKLIYLASAFEAKSEGEIPIFGSSIVEFAKENPECKFSLACNDDEGVKKFYMYGHDHLTRTHWVSHLNTVIQSHDQHRFKQSKREGYLYGSSGSPKNPRKFYVCLLQDKMVYYKKRNDEAPFGKILLPDGGAMVRSSPSAAEIFMVAPNDDEGQVYFFFTASDQNERNSWVRTIRDLLLTKDQVVNQNSIREGYMNGGKKPGQLRKRYFVLFNDKLQYFKKRADTKPEGEVKMPAGTDIGPFYKGTDIGPFPSIQVQHFSELTNVEQKENEEKIDQYLFGIAPTGDENQKYYYIEAKNQAERHEWIMTILKILNNKNHCIRQKSILEGYLYGGDRKGKVRKRYHVLMEDSLLSFKGRNEVKEEKEIKLPPGAVVEDDEDEHLRFFVASSGDANEKKYFLHARNDQDKETWIEALQGLIDSKDSKVNPESILEGYLLGGYKKTSPQKYYFILFRDCLCFYSKRTDSKMAGQVLLPGGSICRIIELNKAPSGSKNALKYGWVVAPTGDEGEKYFYLWAKRSHDRGRWTTSILGVINQKNSQVNAKSLKEGYLLVKKGNKYSKRYCILLEDKMQYFKGRNNKKPAGEIMLPGESECKFVESEPNTFSLALTGDEREELNYFSASNNSSMIDWMRKIKELLVTKRKPKFLNSKKEGYLFISLSLSGSKGGGYKRYCVLFDDEFQYYKKRHDATPEGKIMLNGGAVYENLDGKEHEDMFGLAPTGDAHEKWHYFTVVEKRDKIAWINKIRKLLSTKHVMKIRDSIWEGYLHCSKEKTKSGKKFYCVFMIDKFLIYRSRNDDKSNNQIDLPSGAICDTEDDDGSLGPEKFFVASSGDMKAKKLFLTAQNNDECDVWVTVIDQILRSKEKKKVKNSLMEGYLYQSNSIMAGFKKYYFVLLIDRMLYYTKRNDLHQKGEIVLRDGAAHCEFEDDSKQSERNFLFSLASSGDQCERYIYCSAKTNENRKQWIATVQKLLQSKEYDISKDSIKEGYLWGSFNKQRAIFCKRYFILLKDKLVYFKRRKDVHEAGYIKLSGGALIEEDYAEDRSTSNTQFVPFFYVAESGDANAREFWITCKSDDLIQEWILKIRMIICSKTSKKKNNSLYEGYLQGSAMLKGGRKRMYFVLLPNKLEWFNGRNDSEPSGTFPIEHGGIVLHRHREISSYLFSICTCDDDGAKRYYLMARDIKDLSEWCSALETLVSQKEQNKVKGSKLEGYLMKQGFMKKFNKRYFCLNPEGELSYYISREDPKPKQGHQIGKDVEMIDGPKTEELPFSIILSWKSPKYKLVIGAKDATALATWKSAFQSMIDGRAKLYGGILLDAIKRSQYSGIPNILVECIEFLKKEGLGLEGIFRVPGNNQRIQELKSQFENQDADPIELKDAHSVAGVLKLYFRELADPIIPYSQFNTFTNLFSNSGDLKEDDEQKEMILDVQPLIKQLPQENFDCLNYLIYFLTLVVSQSEENRMTASNCAMVFAPSLLRKPQDQEESGPDKTDQMALMLAAQNLVTEMENSQKMIQTLIVGYDTIFPAGPPAIKKGTISSDSQQKFKITGRTLVSKSIHSSRVAMARKISRNEVRPRGVSRNISDRQKRLSFLQGREEAIPFKVDTNNKFGVAQGKKVKPPPRRPKGSPKGKKNSKKLPIGATPMAFSPALNKDLQKKIRSNN